MEVYRAVLTHIAIPLAGLFLYWLLCQRMWKSDIESPPIIPIFILFSAYGGWIIVFLSMLFGYWSGMTALVFVGLLLVVPVVMGLLALYLFWQRNLSKYHYASFLLSIGYIFFVAALFGIKIVPYLMK